LPFLPGAAGAPGTRLLALCKDWAVEDEPRTALRVIPGGALTPAADAPEPAIAAASNGSLRAATEARVAADRWSDEGGHL
jgi:hypothetical protein